jgi:hypothetical protein
MAGVRVPPGAPTPQCLQSLSQRCVARPPRGGEAVARRPPPYVRVSRRERSRHGAILSGFRNVLFPVQPRPPPSRTPRPALPDGVVAKDRVVAKKLSDARKAATHSAARTRPMPGAKKAAPARRGKRRGRPPGSKNKKPKSAAEGTPEGQATATPKRRGRLKKAAS